MQDFENMLVFTLYASVRNKTCVYIALSYFFFIYTRVEVVIGTWHQGSAPQLLFWFYMTLDSGGGGGGGGTELKKRKTQP